MDDPTEGIRRAMVAAQQANEPLTREQLEELYGQVWDSDEIGQDFKIIGFKAPFIAVERKADGIKGSMEFQTVIGHRFYYNFEEDKR